MMAENKDSTAASAYNIGRNAEDMATAWLKSQGFVILARNFRSSGGEVDIIAQEGENLCFIEVKARGSRRIASASYSVGRGKQNKIIKTARYYLHSRGITARAIRFDVVILDTDGSTPVPELIRDAFRPGWD